MQSLIKRTALLVGAVLAVIATPAAARAQKALVYCPPADTAGCNAIVTALSPNFALGVDRGYDGTGGTVDLKTVDLFAYSVFVVPSLADNGGSLPYAKLRDVEVMEHLKAALIGRIAMWSGSPDQGATNRAMKDALIQNLAAWAVGAFGTAKGPGLVALLDASASASARYDWLRAITPVPVTADVNLLIYDAARALNSRGTTILTSGAGPIAYANMATYGFAVPNGAAGVSLDAVGQTGSAQGGQVILVTAEAGNTSSAIVRTDKDDYAPGQTVTITGSGWQAGETVKLTLHMDPLRDADTELTATADESGNFTNTQFAPAAYDVGVRFVLTAIGQTSGRRAQTTFTDAVALKKVSVSPGSATVTAGTAASFTVTVEFQGSGTAGCTATLSVTGLPSGATASWTPSNTASATNVVSINRTLTINTTTAAPATTLTISATAPNVATTPPGQGCNGSTEQTTASLTINAPANAAPVLGVIGNQSVNENATLSFTATATDANSPPQTLAFSLDAGAPTGATINASSGAFSWTPTEAQGPGTFSATIRVTDNGSPALNDFETISITVNEVNSAPVLAAIGPTSVNEGSALTFTATATDSDLPVNTLAFSLATGTDPVPSGATINSSTGAFSWTPTEAQGPGTYKFKVVVTDNGSPAASDDEEITVTVAEVNAAPVVAPIPDKTVDETNPLAFTATATDTDVPANTLSFSLQGTVPAGASITTAGVFTWTPNEAQGPGTYNIIVRATDNGTPSLFGEATVQITVNEVNAPPTLTGVPASATIPELAAYTFDADATDPDLPAQSLTFSLDGAPAGASINASSGVFTWTPSEAQGPGVYTFKVKVSDGVATPEASITLTVNEVNEAPILAPIGDKTVDELIALAVNATATDADLPANTLTFSLVSAPAGASITAGGAFSWTPTEAQGPGSYTFTVKVTDNGSPTLSDEEQITVTVKEVNILPSLTDVPASATIPELVAYSFDANSTDPDLPAQTLTFSLESAPSGASIDGTTGVFTWTPAEAQGPGSYTFKVKVSDGMGTSEQSVTLAVTEVNVAPVLGAIGDKTVDELTVLSFTAAATDADLPPNGLTYSLTGAPAGASINATSGAFSWTPTEADGPGSYTFTIKVTDDGTPSLSDQETITVTVKEVNVAPVLAAIGNKNVDEETNLSFTATATDADLPPNALSFSVVGGPAGASIDATSGAFSWMPTEAQGPGDYTFKVRVTDNGTPALFDEEEITVTVKEVNKPPVLGAIGNKTVDEETALSFMATATDPDLPPNTLAFTLIGAPAGASITSAGAFSWTPTEAQGPGGYTFTIKVTDNGSPTLSDEEEITVTVNEVNKPPVVASIPDKTVDEKTPLAFTATATDPDIPANAVAFSLAGTVPVGAAITPAGVFTWTPTEAQGPGVYNITVRATDNGTPVLFGETTVKVTVNEVNEAPSLAPIPDKTVDELVQLTFSASATDPDLPPNVLTYALVSAPVGASIDPSTGAFSWTPTEAQGPGVYDFKIRVTDNGTPTLSDEQPVKVTVNEVNVAPVLAPIGNKAIDEETLLTFDADATDSDLPANTLTFSLQGTVPVGAAIDPVTGVFTWTPTEAQGPGPYTFKVRVTDNGSPVLFDEEEITVTVNEVNKSPELGAIGNKTVDEETALTFTATATDVDLPPNTLTFSLVGAPAGASINPSTGAFTWTPTESQGPGSYTFTVKVTDDGVPVLSDEEQITVTVKEVNKAPTVATIGAKTVNEGVALTFTATATDPDLPANGLAFSLLSPPAGATIDPTTGALSWTPPDGPTVPSPFIITVRVTDNGTPALSDDEQVAVTVNNVNPTATFNAPPGPFNEGQSFAISLTSPSDVPADVPTLKYAFDCGTGTGYGAASATSTVTCPAANDPGQSVKGKIIDKDGGFSEYTGNVAITNVAPTVTSILLPATQIALGSTANLTAKFTDPGLADTHTYSIDWDWDLSTNLKTPGSFTSPFASVSSEPTPSTPGSLTSGYAYPAAGVYTVRVTVRDNSGDSGFRTSEAELFAYVVVYDPSAGFVTGGGWIDSPSGACMLTAACTGATGKANFGFVSKYQKGQSTPTGNTEFQFKAGNINFHSSLYDWLVVAGAKAQYKGTGKINGSGNYGFMLTAVDGQLNGGGGADKFRIKIWDKNNGDAVVYDNQLLSPDDSTPTTLLGGGSINIQSK